MPRLLDHLTDLFKKTDTIDHALRYNAVFYSPALEYIEVFYNRLRCYSTLGYYSPAEFEARTAVA